MFAREFVSPPGERWPSAHAASAVLLPDGRLMASWFAGSREGAPDAAVWAGEWRRDEGWSEQRVLADSPGQADGNSVLWLDGAGSLRLWYVTMEGKGWATCVVRERRSPDLGLTWRGDAYVRREWGWMVRNEPVRWRGWLLMPMYDERDWSSFILASGDGGETWREPAPLRARPGIIQPALAPLGDGGVLAFMRSRGGAIYRARCQGGSPLVWSDPEPAGLPNPNSAVELIGLASGSLLAVFNPTARGRSPLRVALSDDGGETWPSWRDLETEPGEFSYPTALQSPDGVIHALYTWRRQTIAHARFDEGWLRGDA
jgi:predicted neuraminidase